MKKILSIIICIALVFNSGAYIFFYWQVQNMFKQQGISRAHSAASRKMLEKIIISGESGMHVKWNSAGEDEFKYAGKYYDIVHKEIVNGDLVLYCISDENEDKLEAAFANQVENRNDKTTAPVKTILKQIITEGLEKSTAAFILSGRTAEFSVFFIDHYESFHSEIPHRPPEEAC